MYKDTCPHCGESLVGDKVWDHFKRLGIHKGVSESEAERYADNEAAKYGANREFGHFNRSIAIFDRQSKKTTAFECPDCNMRWWDEE